MSVSTNPFDTLTLVKPFECSKKVIRYQTFIASPEGSFVVRAEELTEDLRNFLEELEGENMKKEGVNNDNRYKRNEHTKEL